MHLTTVLDWLLQPTPDRRRVRRRLNPAVGQLEGRTLLSNVMATATMTQTATYPILESSPNTATQAFLYFSAPMGTLTQVDVITSGTFTTQFYAENPRPTNSQITGTTSASLSINVPSGSIPLSIPSVTESFTAAPYDGTLDYGGTSGKAFAPETSSSAPQTTVLTSPADLAAFTGYFRMPISVTGHATGSATSSSGALSDGFNTQTSVTITIIDHFIPNLPSLDPPTGSGNGSTTSASANPPSSDSSPASSPAPIAPAGTGAPIQAQPTPTPTTQPSTQAKKEKTTAILHHKSIHHGPGLRVRQATTERTGMAGEAHRRQ
jgi:hypothetical protein